MGSARKVQGYILHKLQLDVQFFGWDPYNWLPKSNSGNQLHGSLLGFFSIILSEASWLLPAFIFFLVKELAH